MSRKKAALASAVISTLVVGLMTVFSTPARHASAAAVTRSTSSFAPVAAQVQEMKETVAEHAVAAQPVLPATYTVASGDVLSTIAPRFSTDWPSLWWANRSKVPDPNILRVGQVLTLPSRGTRASAAVLTAANSAMGGGTVSSSGSSAIRTAAALTGSPGSYPLRAVSNLSVGRIDEGQDFCGSGPLFAVGTGVIRQVWGGWPGGVYILEYVNGGAASGRYIYFAESISPKVSVGQSVSSATEIGYMYQSSICIEIGWGTSTPSTPLAWGHYVSGQPTAEGYSMAAFLRSLR